MDKNFVGISCSFYTVKQLASLFGKSEDAIRRWKNEGLGKDEDNIKLRAVEREDGSGRKNARHLVFTREAVIEFVKANPFLMDEAPQLALMMQAEGAWKNRPLSTPEEHSDWYDFLEDEYDDEPYTFGRQADGMFAEDRERENIWQEFERRTVEFSPHRHRTEADEDWHDRVEAFRRRIRASTGFDHEDDGEETYESYSRGWRNPMPRGDRRRGEEEYRRRRKIVDFALETLRKHSIDLDNQYGELESARQGLEMSDMEAALAKSLEKVIDQRQKELSEQMDMLEEFIEVIEAEMEEE